MTKSLLALACLTVLTVAACKPPSAEPAADTPAVTETTPAAVDVVSTGDNMPSDNQPSDNANFDMRGFAGTFSATLPCASCPGIETTLVLNADGSYELSETYQDEDGAPVSTDGTWTVLAEQIRLDPNSKSEPDRLFAITSQQEITLLDASGNLAESGLDYSLDRQAAN
ncbi:copper resistance protein NlpE [Lysobacter sp. A378]